MYLIWASQSLTTMAGLDDQVYWASKKLLTVQVVWIGKTLYELQLYLETNLLRILTIYL